MARFKFRTGAWLGALLLTAAALTACSGGSSGGGSAKGDPAKPVDLLKWAGPGPVVTLDGSVAGDAASMDGIYLASGQLTRFNADGKPVLDLAESVDMAKDGLTATIKLRPNLKYSDGTPITSEDFQYAVERNRKGTGASFVATIKSVDVVDDTTAVAHLKGPDPDFLTWLAERGTQLHPKKLIESDPDYWKHPVSGGPYMVDKGWTPGSDVFRAVENPNYPKGPMMAKAIEIRSVPDAASRVLQVTSGELDAAIDLPLSSKDNFPAEVKTSYAGVGGTNYVVANETLGGPFANAKVRQAMSYAIDRKSISQKAFFGLQPASTSPMFNCGDLCERDLLPEKGARDVAKAKQLMQEAGYANGFDAEMKVSSGRGGWQEAAVIVAQNLADIGIRVKVTPVDEGQHFSSITKQNYQLFFTGGGGKAQSTLSQMLNTGDFWVKATGWTPPAEAAEVMQRTASELDPAKRREAYTEAQKIWMDAMHVIPVTERIQLNASRVSPNLLVLQVKNDQKVIVQTVAEAKQGLKAGSL
ncbi:ABC transporter substrate-binding protein [Planosporangium thailandense]|uniref:ABC transporter substrate-binding protein n=1 Tax=Planosporangium thailandense TaxID=765197 RepID=A0ABX0Y3J0_9ACTN|nr:ABC transporter substrate-binding protein [Planosporangium thailandense]NJC72960.1 ABC transporter substrate-binding protein [Planosporangium thailandense]